LGREFDTAVLCRAAGLDDAAAMDALLDLSRKHIIEDAAPARHRFVHDGLREIAYARVARGELGELHRRAALAIEAHHRDQPTIQWDLAALAHHWAACEASDRASHYADLAGDRAAAAYAHREAVAFYEVALREKARELQKDASQPRPASWLMATQRKRGELLALAGRQLEAAGAFNAALDDASDGTDRSHLFRRIGKTHEIHHHHDRALEFYARAESALGTPPIGRADASPAWWAEWLNLQIDRVMVHYWLAQPDAMDAIVEQIRAAPRDGVGVAHKAQLFKSLVYMNMRRERYALSDQTVAYARARLDSSVEWGDEGEIVEATFMHALALLFNGRVEDAEREFLGGLPVVERRRDETLRSRFIAYLTVAQRRRRDVEATTLTASRCIEVARACGMNEYVGAGSANLGWVAWRSGDGAGARRACESAIEAWAGLTLVYPCEWLARAVLMAEDLREGAVGRAVEHARRMLDPKQQALPRELAALLERAGEELDDATPVLARAVQVAENVGYL
jgi:hypothetical protein